MQLTFEGVGKPTERYPRFVLATKGKSGVYVIRKRAGLLTAARVVYIGESHTGNLYGTLTRHFQQWRRGKRWWVGQFQPAQTDPGHTYDRGDHEVAVIVATPKRAVTIQDELIRKLEPRDNALEVVPF
jgi:hypothetical protein